MGVLGWPPDAFWGATIPEFWVAFAGWRRANTSSKTKADDARPMNADELHRQRELMRRFPDGPRRNRKPGVPMTVAHANRLVEIVGTDDGRN